ncbi:MAG: GT4 family glycosyltransferase PelF [Candidatus Odinarchaeum yellowstonii]|uniref:GT4 family glycosyltransferase PelF n=1 Tax=Odinarchaeota yellowstonii (strain LCB_4) TaxID=1841599 RepID=A0AAF0D1Z6_ODILC|nr:MAG: GT4 family glycosyltransferase PelF [Candidatus Odinarchaeum yellowstonii]
MPKVCLITEGTYPLAIGGVSKWTHTLVSKMPDVEFEILSLTPDRTVKFNYKPPRNVKEIHLHPIWEDFSSQFNEKAVQPCVNDSARKIKQFFQAETASFSSNTYLNEGFIKPLERVFNIPIPEADIYHALNAGYAGLIAGLAKQIYNKPVIITEHGSYYKEWILRLSRVDFPDELRHPKILKPEDHTQIKLLKFIGKLVEFSFKSADVITPVTGAHIPLELKLGADPRKIKPIPNGVDCERFTSSGNGEQNDEPVVGTVARLNPIKDVKTLIKAARLVIDEKPNVRFEFIGPKEDLEYYNESLALVEDLRLENNFHFLPETHSPEKLYSRFQVFALSSISEAQPLALLEAMSSGVPIVATRVGGVPEPVDGCGLLVNPGEYESLAKGILFYLRNPEYKREIGFRARNRIMNRYSESLFINEYRRVYFDLAGKPKIY